MPDVAPRPVSDQKPKSLIEALKHLIRRQQSKARSGQLKSERHAIEPLADIRNRRGICLIEAKIRLDVGNARQQQRNRGRSRHLRDIGLIEWVSDCRQAQWRHAHHALADEIQLLLRGCQDPQVLGAAQDLRHQSAHLDGDLIAIIEQQQRPPVRQRLTDFLEHHSFG